MANPEGKESFLARLMVVAAVGVILFQLFMAFEVSSRDAFTVLFIVPCVSHLVIGLFYYLFKGSPKEEDPDSAVLKVLLRLAQLSMLVGIICVFVVKFKQGW